MNLSHDLETILKNNPKQSSATHLFIEKVRPYISNESLPFFPEYTQHSIQHNLEILQTCHELVTKASLEKLSPSDVSALTLAVFLHDIAMHLTEDGFLSLIDPNQTKWNPIAAFHDKPWHIAWFDYLSEAKRWDDRKLISVFGEPEPIKEPPSKTIDFTLRDKLLIGEFIRRNHGRLAHQIALSGIPGAGGNNINLFNDFDSDYSTEQ
ncbi:MAG: hypothetical protein R2825_20335 [Saprospiraceae bacterium]